jgi:hypothetical protein
MFSAPSVISAHAGHNALKLRKRSASGGLILAVAAPIHRSVSAWRVRSSSARSTVRIVHDSILQVAAPLLFPDNFIGKRRADDNECIDVIDSHLAALTVLRVYQTNVKAKALAAVSAK